MLNQALKTHFAAISQGESLLCLNELTWKHKGFETDPNPDRRQNAMQLHEFDRTDSWWMMDG